MSDKNFKVKNGIDAVGPITISPSSNSITGLIINSVSGGKNITFNRNGSQVGYIDEWGGLVTSGGIQVAQPWYTRSPGIEAQSFFWAGSSTRSAAGFGGTNAGTSPVIYISSHNNGTNDLTQWIRPDNTVLAKVDYLGNITANDLTLSGNLTVNGTTTNLNSTNLIIEDKNIIIADVDTPTDTTADGAGITIKGATDKTLNWVQSTKSFTTSEPVIINNSSTDVPTLIVKLNTGQTSNIQEWRDHVGNVVAKIGPLYGSNIFQFDPFSYGAGSGYSSIGIGGRFISNEQRAAQSKFGVTTGEWVLGALRATDNQVGAFAASTTLPTFVIKGIASQTADLQQWQDSTGAVLAKVDNIGDLTLLGVSGIARLVVGTNGNSTFSTPGIAGIGAGVSGTYQLNIGVGTGNRVGVRIYGNSLQTANLTEWQNSSGTVLASIDASGKITTPSARLASTEFYSNGNVVFGGNLTQVNGLSVGAGNSVSARLQVLPYAATQVPVIVQGFASQTANLTEWKNSAGNYVGYITSSGSAIWYGNSIISGDLRVGTATYFGGALNVSARIASETASIVRGATSQTANLQEWQNSDGTVLSKIKNDGYLYVQNSDNSMNVGIGSNNIYFGRAAGTYLTNTSVGGVLSHSATASSVGDTIVWTSSTNGLRINSSSQLSASVVPLVVIGSASQTAAVQQWQNSSGGVLSEIRNNGQFRSGVGAIFGSVSGYTAGLVSLFNNSASQVPLFIQASPSQTADLQQWVSSINTVVAKVDASGNITDASNTAWLSPIGSGSDDAPTIQALIDGGKKEIRLGSGQWTFSTRIKVPNGVTIRGIGTSTTSTTGTRVNAVALIASEGTVRDITFTGAGENAQNELGGGGIAVLGGRVINCSVTDSRWVLAPTRQPHGYLKNFMSKMQSGYGSVRVAILGDSLSENTSTTSWYGYLFNSSTSATGYYLGSYFGHQIATSEVDNMAIGGQGAYLLSAQLAMTKDTLRTGGYVNQVLDGDNVSASPFFNRNYNLAIIAIGQNGGEDWKAHLEYVVKTIRDKGIEVILLTQNPAAGNPTSRAGDEYYYRSMAETYGCLLIDTQAYYRLEVEFGRALGTTADLFGDAIHQSTLGHQLYAKAILNGILDYDSTITVPANKTVVSRSYLPAQTTRATVIAGMNAYYLVKNPDSARDISGVTYTTATDSSIRNPIYGRGTTTNSVATLASGGYATWGVEYANAAYIIYRENSTSNTLTISLQGGTSTLATLTTGVTNGRTSVQKVTLSGGTAINRPIRITNTSGDPVQIYGVVFETHADVAFNRNSDGSYPGVKLNGSWSYGDFLDINSYGGFQTPYTSTVNDSVTFKFYGDGLRFATSYGKNSGIIQVKIDDTTYTAVDTYLNIGSYGVYTHFYGGLQYGLHTATITLTGANASVTGNNADGARFGLHRISAVRSSWYLTQDQQFAPNSDISAKINSLSSPTVGSVGGANIMNFWNGTSGYGAGSITSNGTFNINNANIGFPYTSSGATVNVNAGSASTIPLTVRGVASQTADLQEWQDSSGTAIVEISANGSIITRPVPFSGNQNRTIIGATDTGNNWGQGKLSFKSDSNGYPRFGFTAPNAPNESLTLKSAFIGINTIDPLAQLHITPYGASEKGLIVKGYASQTANLQEWQNSSGTAIAKVDSSGYITSGIFYANSNHYAGYQIIGGRANVLLDSSAAMGMVNWNVGLNTLQLRNVASQTADSLKIENSSGTAIARIDASGNLFAVSKSFDIEHPTKENMRLRYASLEGPENGVYIRGTATTNIIELPDYWTGLVYEDSITVSLTSVGSAQNIYVEKIEDNKIYIGGELQKAFFTVYGERKDIDKLTVEY